MISDRHLRPPRPRGPRAGRLARRGQGRRKPRHHQRRHQLSGTTPGPLSQVAGPRKRAELQRKNTPSSRRRLARRSRKERRHAAHVNHGISKEIVAVAQRTGRGIAVEELGGIRDRVRLRRDQRATLSSWPFHQLGQHLAYKARRAGVPFIEVDAAYTSQRCPRCGHTERANRPTRDTFRCRQCGLVGPADVVAGTNVRDRARLAWVFVTMPVPHPAQPVAGDASRDRPVVGDSRERDKV
ncbi:RNA-guided endonuclease TnpB family protein [Streptomyces sp. NPDC059875]|uniref:RNA-guided endonuclease TnpB family protein n=1 Tax=unclassified Streptomyces TaxID=2593676 RepID=UPI00365B0860